MPILYYDGWYTPELCQENRDSIFVFGDNARRYGMGGQAIIRREPNTYGIATKRVGNMVAASFFREGNDADRKTVDDDLDGLRRLLEKGEKCVIPIERGTGNISLGLARARLRETAPSLYEHIVTTILKFADEFGSEFVEYKQE